MSNLIILPPVIGHRGAAAYAPENTIISFIKAAQLGIKWVEFDVMQAASGEAIIFHDENLDRTTNGHGRVAAYSYHELVKLDAGAWFDYIYSSERIPTLTQTLDFLQHYKMSANIELKPNTGDEQALVRRVLADVSATELLPHTQILYSSFSFPLLRYLRTQAPDCLIGLLLHAWETDWQTMCEELNCVSVHVNETILTASLAKQIKALDKQLLCYTVNDPARAQELFAWGVDAVFSDAPDRLVNMA